MKIIVTNKQSTIKVLEKKIEKGLEAFREAGESLRIIKEQKLYKDQYGTYEEYCRQRWGFTPQHANRLIGASALIAKMEQSEPTGSVLPQSEAQARVLVKTDNPSDAWKKAQKASDTCQPSARQIAESIEEEHKDTIDAEIIEDNSDETDTSIGLLIKNAIDNPYKIGSKTGRPQVSVEVDDITVLRLSQLKEHFRMPKASVVAQALLLLKETVELQSQKDKS